MIRVTCPSCRSKLNAKAELAGQTRKCPKCGTPVVIAYPDTPPGELAEEAIAVVEAPPDQHVHGVAEEKLPPIAAPDRLVRQNKYLICDKTKVYATWENNGHGWMLKCNFGFISAHRNPEKLPAQGDFMLIELQLGMTDDGLRLQGIMVYELTKRWALTKLDQGDDRILSSITGSGHLNKEQKSAIRAQIKEQFMRQVWENADDVIDFLSNTDYHSAGPVRP